MSAVCTAMMLLFKLTFSFCFHYSPLSTVTLEDIENNGNAGEILAKHTVFIYNIFKCA